MKKWPKSPPTPSPYNPYDPHKDLFGPNPIRFGDGPEYDINWTSGSEELVKLQNPEGDSNRI